MHVFESHRTVPLEASTPDATSLDVSPRQPPNRMRLAMAQDGPKELDIALSKLALETKLVTSQHTGCGGSREIIWF